MPLIAFDVRELQVLLGRRVPREKLLEAIPMLGADVERAEGDAWAVEFFPNRPDLYSVEGIARALRAFLGIKPGLRSYEVARGREELRVEASVKPVRPIMRMAVVKGVRVTGPRIQSLMELQEDLHWGVGARRRKASIGVHDKAKLVPPYTYKAVGLDDVAFVPLQGTEPMTPREILAQHPKGQAFAHLVQDKAPLLVDSLGQVLSFPPIINGTLTTVTERTRDVLVDCTGLDERAVTKALHLVVTQLAEQGGRVESVAVLEGRRRLVSPDLGPERWSLRPEAVRRLLGLELEPAEIARALRRMGHGATPAKGKVEVEVPCYRTDVLHEVDLVEDVAIGFGYARLPYERPRAVTHGKPLEVERRSALAREVLLGLGFTEVMTLSLASEKQQFGALGREEGAAARIQNPVTEEHTSLRGTLLASLLATLQKNVHRDYPQGVFEVGDVVVLSEHGLPANRRMLAWVRAHSRAGFSEAKSLALAVARDLALGAEVEAHDDAAFVPGRCAALVRGGEVLGWFGELHPRTLEAFDLTQPAVAMELRLGPEALREA